MKTRIRVPELSITEADCRFTFARGSGKGGQKRNKTSSAVRCTHIESGAVGYSDDSRSQHDNKRRAFEKMTHTQQFNEWHVRKMAEMEGICDPNDLLVETGK